MVAPYQVFATRRRGADDRRRQRSASSLRPATFLDLPELVEIPLPRPNPDGVAPPQTSSVPSWKGHSAETTTRRTRRQRLTEAGVPAAPVADVGRCRAATPRTEALEMCNTSTIQRSRPHAHRPAAVVRRRAGAAPFGPLRVGERTRPRCSARRSRRGRDRGTRRGGSDPGHEPRLGIFRCHDPRPPGGRARARLRALRRDRRGGRLTRRDRPRPRRDAARRSATSPSRRRRRPPRAHRRGRPRGSTASRSSTSPTAPSCMHLGGKIEVSAKVAAEDARRPLDGLHAGRRPRLPAIADDPERAFNLTIKQQHGRHRHRRHRRARPRRHRPRGRDAGDGRQGDAVQGVRRRRRLADLPRRPRTPTRSSRRSKAIAPGFGGINLEDIAAPRCFEIEERLRARARHPRLPRRPARHRRRRPGRAAERAAGRRQADRGRARRASTASARPASPDATSCSPPACANHRLRPRRRDLPRPRRA